MAQSKEQLLEKARIRQNKYFKDDPQKIIARNKAWRKRRRPEYLAGRKRTRMRIREEALVIYGRKCVCCGETEIKFLAFDHINGRKGLSRVDPTSNYKRLIKDKPTDIQILCHNCNMAKGFYGQCPHK